VLKLDPHVASLGLRFYTGKLFPAEYQNQVFIAEHGSWNRSKPIGYRVMLVRLKDNKPAAYLPFAEGWLQGNGDVLGRPVDVQVAADGALLISDDLKGAVYRVVPGV
jgi:glucose/arabinose dehydrogenase